MSLCYPVFMCVPFLHTGPFYPAQFGAFHFQSYLIVKKIRSLSISRRLMITSHRNLIWWAYREDVTVVTLNVGMMTGRERELADLMERMKMVGCVCRRPGGRGTRRES